MSRKTRRREFLLSSDEIVQLLDFDDSDEEALFEIDDEDEVVLAESVPDKEDEVRTVEIVDGQVPEEEPPANTDSGTTVVTNFCWSRNFPPVIQPGDDPPDNSAIEWGKVMIPYESMPTPAAVFADVCKLDELVNDILVPQSTLYMHQNGKAFEIENEEMKAFLGMNVMMSYHVLPEIHDYFSNEPDLRVQPIAETMVRDRFYSIRRSLHFSNNDEAPDKKDPTHDRAWKLRPLIKHFNAAFQNAMSPTFEQAIDERMTKFKGHHIMKQYMKQKPIQRGFKHWCRNDSRTGYLYQFDIYAGKKTASPEFGLAENVVLELTDSLKDSSCRMFFDNFYTSPQLVYRLMTERKIYSCGTVREHRRGLPKDMKATKDLKKGEMDSRYYHGMSVVKWIDTKPVTMISSIDNGDPENTVNVKRRKKGHDGKVDVKVPAMVQRYNKCMRGTDLLDQKTTVYAFDRRSPGKYYCRPFWDYIDMGLANSFIVYEQIAAKFSSGSRQNVAKTQKDFRRMVAIELIGDFSSRKKAPFNTKRYRSQPRHRIEYAERHGRCKRCYREEKKDRKGFIRCVDCDVYLCLNKSRNCWEQFHQGQ